MTIVDQRTKKPRIVEDIYDLDEESDGALFRCVVKFAFDRTIRTSEGFHDFELQTHLKERGYVVTQRAVREILSELDYRWTGKDQYYGQNLSDDVLNGQKRKFFLLLSQALQLERDQPEKYVFGTQDESWGNENSNNNHTHIHWCPFCNHPTNPCWISSQYRTMDDADGVHIRTRMNKGGKGKRVLFSHIVTKYGLLNGYTRDLDEEFVDKVHVYNEQESDTEFVYNIDSKICGNLDNVLPSCEFVMRCGKGGGDYHDNMDAPKFKKLMINRTVPAMESRHPGKSLLVLEDQAPYHVARTGFVDCNKSPKQAIFDWLWKSGCRRLVVIRNKKRKGVEVAMTETKVFDFVALKRIAVLPRAPKGPSRDELLYAGYQWAKKYCPDELRIDIEVALNEKGHYPIWNVPNCPQYNPSELLNAHSKRNMREDFETGRQTERLCRDLQIGMNGGLRLKQNIQHNPADAQMCQNWIRHCLDTVKADGDEIGLEGEVVDWWTADCGVDLFKPEIKSPLSAKRIKEMMQKFSIDMSEWPDVISNDNSNNSNSSSRS